MSLVKFDVAPCEMASVLTTESLEEMDLKVGDKVTITLPNNMEPTDLDYFEPNTLAISVSGRNTTLSTVSTRSTSFSWWVRTDSFVASSASPVSLFRAPQSITGDR